MASQYHIVIPVDKHEVTVIRKEFGDFIKDAGTFTMTMDMEDDSKAPSPELERAIKDLFIRVIFAIRNGKFERMN